VTRPIGRERVVATMARMHAGEDIDEVADDLHVSSLQLGAAVREMRHLVAEALLAEGMRAVPILVREQPPGEEPPPPPPPPPRPLEPPPPPRPDWRETLRPIGRRLVLELVAPGDGSVVLRAALEGPEVRVTCIVCEDEPEPCRRCRGRGAPARLQLEAWDVRDSDAWSTRVLMLLAGINRATAPTEIDAVAVQEGVRDIMTQAEGVRK
jgi:hypothetical protein